jgi:molecular chaperone DnaK (HSP70)
MYEDAQKYEEEDRLIKERIDARNDLENYIYNVRNSLDNTELKDKIGNDKLEELNKLITESIQWLDDNDDLSKDEYLSKQKDIQSIVNPILISANQNDNNTGDDENDEGPKVEEVK